MKPFDKLMELKLLNWSTVFLGLKKGWVERGDVISYSVDLLELGSDDDRIAEIAGGEFLNDQEFLVLVSALSNDENGTLVRWRLANLLCIADADISEQAKIDKLQEIYAMFDYPEDMLSCSIYSQDQVDPLVAMAEVIRKLHTSILV